MRVLCRAPLFATNMGTRCTMRPVSLPLMLYVADVLDVTRAFNMAHVLDMTNAPVLQSMLPVAMSIPRVVAWMTVAITGVSWISRMPMYGSIAVPACAMTVKRTLPVMVVPVGTDHEADDRNADLRAVLGQQHAPVTIRIAHVIASDPTALATGDHVAPLPTRGAALHRDSASGGNDIDQWIAGIRSGAQAEIGGDVGVLGHGRQRCQHQQGSQRGQEQSLCGLAVHGVFSVVNGCIRLPMGQALGGQDDSHWAKQVELRKQMEPRAQRAFM